LADQNIVTNITATANFSSLTAQLQAVTAQMLKLQTTTVGLNKNLTSQVGVMNRQFDDTMRSTGQFSRHFVTLTSDVSKFGQNLDSGKMKLGQYFKTWQGHTQKTSSLVKDLAKQQVMLENAVVQPLGKNAQGLMQYNVMVQSGLDATKNKTALLRQELSIMNKVMNNGAGQLINWGKNTQWAGRQLTVGLTVPLAAFGMAAAKAFKQADEALVRLTKVYGGLTATSTEDLLQVRRDVSALSRELASSLGANFTETISLAADIAATGKEGAELLDSTRQTTRLAVLGEVDRQDAMKATLAIQTAFGQSTLQLAESIDFLNAVENQTSTTLEDLVTAIPKAGPVVKALGGDIQDLALYLTAMREGGINASEGANALKSALASIINPTKVAKDMFNGLGIDLSGIVDKNAGNLTGTIMALKDSLDSLEPLQRARAIEQLFGKFQFARINALFENLGKQGSQTLQVLDLMKASTQDLASISERELKTLTESASGKYRRALESVKAELATVGEQFLKVGAFVLNAIDGILKFIGNLPGPIKAVLGFIGGLTAIAGPIIMLTGVLANFFGYIIKGIFALKNIGKGGTGFKLLTPELVAASAAAKTVEESFYSDTKAAATFSDAVMTLAASFEKLKQSAMSSTIATSNSMSTVAGNPVMGVGGRIVDKNNPLAGKPYSRDMSHMIPTGSKTAEQRANETIFSTVPGPKPVNQRISNAPQVYMNTDMPKIPGVTSINGISTGVVSAEAAKWHSMTAAIAMQSKAEIALLKTEIAATGTMTASITDSYQALLPQMTKITSLAAKETGMIVDQLQAGKLTVEAARTKIFALNARVEAMMAQTAQGIATAQARTLNLGMVPLTNQPVVSALGKSNMKELFHKTETSKLVDQIARGLGVRTSGAGYSIQTTKPRGLNSGGYVYHPGKDGAVVPGDTSINYDNTMAKVPLGGFVLNQEASKNNPKLVSTARQGYNSGGMIDAILTPGETVVSPEIYQQNKQSYDVANKTKRPISLISTGEAVGGMVMSNKNRYGLQPPEIFSNSSSQYVGMSALTRTKEYLDYLTSSSYQADAKPNLILNDATAILRNSKDPRMTPEIAVKKATLLVESSLASHESFLRDGVGLSYTDSQQKLMKENFPDLVETRPAGMNDKEWAARRRAISQSDVKNREAKLDILNILKRKFPRSTLYPNADRAHIERSIGPIATRGYAGSAMHDPFNNFSASLTARLGIDDYVPLTKDEAILRAKRVSQYLGFKNVNDFMKNLPKIEEFISTGKWNGKGPIPESLVKALGGNMRVFEASKIRSIKPKPVAPTPRANFFGRGRLAMNSGGEIGGAVKPGKYNYGRMFLGMPRGIKAVETQRKARKNMEDINASLMSGRFAKMKPTDFGTLRSPTSGRSFPVSGIGGVYEKPDGSVVFVKPVMDERAALAEQRATIIAREAHGLKTPVQTIRTMIDPTDPTGKRKLLVLESPYDKAFVKQSGKFTEKDYFKQLVAANLRGDKDLSRDNLSGGTLNDMGNAGVFKMASGLRPYEPNMPSMSDQARINLLGVKGGAKRFFAESTLEIPKGMTAKQYHEKMISEIDQVLPKLKATIKSFDLNKEEAIFYKAMTKRLEDGRKVNWEEFHGIHSAVKTSASKQLTPAALLKLKTETDLRIRQRGHARSLSDNAFKSNANEFNAGGVIGNVMKSMAMRRIGAGFGPTGAPKPSMYESAPWGVNSLTIGMGNKLFGTSGLTKNTQNLFYDKFAAALAKEKPYGYLKDSSGSLKNALEPHVMDSVVRSAASNLISDRNFIRQLSPIDKDILRKKYLNWDSKKDTPLTALLQKEIFGIAGKREMGGPVLAGQKYIVGEKGPELFSPQQSGTIVPNYELGGIIKAGKYAYGRSGNPAQRAMQEAEKRAKAAAYVPAPVAQPEYKDGPLSGSRTTFVGNRGVRTNSYGVQGSLPYMPGLTLGHESLNKTQAALKSAAKQIEMSLYALGTSVKKDAITLGKNIKFSATTLKYSANQLIVGARMYGSDLSAGISLLGSKLADSSRRTLSKMEQVRKSYFSPQTMASRPPGVAFNPGYIDASGNKVEASRVPNAARLGFKANLGYTTRAMLNPIQYGRAVLNKPRPLDGQGNPISRGSGAGGMMLGTIGGMAAGTAIGGKIGGSSGAMMGSMVGMMAGPQLMQSAGKMIAGRALLSAGSGAVTAGFGATAAAAAGVILPLAAVAAALYGGYKAFKHYKEGQELNLSTFGLTAEAAKKANLRFTDFGSKIKETIQDSKDMAAANKLVYESMKDGGTPFQMTIAEYKKLKVEVKETFAEQIKALDRQPSTKVPDAVRRIKEQLIAAGMSADEATKKVFTMLQLSNKKDQSITATMGNSKFRSIIDAQTAAVSSVESFGTDTKTQGNKEKAASLNTALMATETGINDLIEKRERLVAKDLTGKTKSLTYAEAEKIMIDKINKSKEAGAIITQGTVDEMAKTNPEVKKMINGLDTVVSVYQKIRLQAQGYKGDLSELNAAQTAVLSQAFSKIRSVVESTNKIGILKEQYTSLGLLEEKIKSYTRALKGQSVAEQISDKDRIKSLNKQVDANNKLADARKKALTAAQSDADLGRQIEKTRLEMENASSTGDTAKAQSLRIDLESLTSQQQTESQVRAIDKATEAANKPLQAALEAMANKQEKLANSAALAGESLDKIRDKYTKQEAAINKVNDAMTALYGNAAAAGKTIEQYVATVEGGREAAGLVGATEATTGVKSPKYATQTGYVGSELMTRKVAVSPEQNALGILAKSGASSGVNQALADSIKGGKTLADVVNAVKGIDPQAKKNVKVTGDYSKSMESKTFDGKKVDVLNAQARNAIVEREKLNSGDTFEINGQKYKVGGAGGGQVVYMGKAATGVMGGKGMFLVGEKGPEMVHLGSPANIMPNDIMNKLAAASPRYKIPQSSFNVSGQSTSGASYVVNQNIYASDGMDVEALSNMIIQKAQVVIGQKAKVNVKMVGQGKNI
jgi:TP901 family phage tail tape measure protein